MRRALGRVVLFVGRTGGSLRGVNDFGVDIVVRVRSRTTLPGPLGIRLTRPRTRAASRTVPPRAPLGAPRSPLSALHAPGLPGPAPSLSGARRTAHSPAVAPTDAGLIGIITGSIGATTLGARLLDDTLGTPPNRLGAPGLRPPIAHRTLFATLGPPSTPNLPSAPSPLARLGAPGQPGASAHGLRIPGALRSLGIPGVPTRADPLSGLGTLGLPDALGRPSAPGTCACSLSTLGIPSYLGHLGRPGLLGLLSTPGLAGALARLGVPGTLGPADALGRAGVPGTPSAFARFDPPGSLALRGVPGPLGLLGSTGLAGPLGRVGPLGTPGPLGLPGLAGLSGRVGLRGVPGPAVALARVGPRAQFEDLRHLGGAVGQGQFAPRHAGDLAVVAVRAEDLVHA
ncbi:hypothetical protein DF268_44515, partial [Streptomyces sp. V2]